MNRGGYKGVQISEGPLYIVLPNITIIESILQLLSAYLAHVQF